MSFDNLIVKTEVDEKCTSTGPYFNQSNTSPTENLVENNEKCTSTTPYFAPSTLTSTVKKEKEEPVDNEASAQWANAQPGFTYIQDEYTSDFGIRDNTSSQSDNFHLTSTEPNRYYNNVNVNVNAHQYQFCDLAYPAGGSSPATSVSLSNSSLSPDSHSLQNVPTYQQHHHIDKMAMSRKSITYCKVCGDKASGYHYGVTSCEGCKGFFRRSIQRKSDYRCLKMQACEIRRESRNRCQYCRFKKCLDSGMSKESVRQIKRNSKQAASVAGSSDSEGHVSSSTSPEPVDYQFKQVAQQISQAHSTISPYTDLKVRNMVAKLYSVSGTQESQETIASRLNAWQQFSVEVENIFKDIVHYVKEIPKFSIISADQQASLLKKHSFAVYVLFVARGLSSKGLFLPDGRLVTFNDLRLLYGTLADDMLVFANKLLSFGLTDGDIAVFMTVILSQPLKEWISQSGNKTQTEIIHDLFHKTLYLKLNTRPNGVELYQALLRMIDDLHMLETNHFNQLKCLRDHSQIVLLPELFLELYSIDKRVLTHYNHQQVPQQTQYHPHYTQQAHHVQC